eukprot:6686559-Prymnesium_polylepis.1
MSSFVQRLVNPLMSTNSSAASNVHEAAPDAWLTSALLPPPRSSSWCWMAGEKAAHAFSRFATLVRRCGLRDGESSDGRREKVTPRPPGAVSAGA